MKTKEDRACTPGADASKAINRVAKDISKSKSVKVAASAKLHPFDVAIGQNDATCSKVIIISTEAGLNTVRFLNTTRFVLRRWNRTRVS